MRREPIKYKSYRKKENNLKERISEGIFITIMISLMIGWSISLNSLLSVWSDVYELKTERLQIEHEQRLIEGNKRMSKVLGYDTKFY
jgi:hypothetical protein